MASKEKASLNQLLDALDGLDATLGRAACDAAAAKSVTTRQEYLKAQEAVCQELGWTLAELTASALTSSV